MRHSISASVIAALAALAIALPALSADRQIDVTDFTAMRALLVEHLVASAQRSEAVTGVGKFDREVLDAMGTVPRHEFVPEALQPLAYFDTPLPLGPLPGGEVQNVAQPFLVALMTQLARVSRNDIVFETGTDSGYHAAVLSRLAKRVYSMEVIEVLVEQATDNLARTGHEDISIRHGDGYYGWPEKGPFDVIIVKEAVHHLPPPLLQQLKPGGRMVAPVGPLDGTQMLTLVEKDEDGTLRQRRVLPVRFAPLQGGERI